MMSDEPDDAPFETALRAATESLADVIERRRNRPGSPERILVSAAVGVLRAALDLDHAALERNDELAHERDRRITLAAAIEGFLADRLSREGLAAALELVAEEVRAG